MDMDKDLLGKTCAVASALLWAVALILFKWCGEKIPPLALNLFKNVVGLILLVATLLCLGHGLDMVSPFPIRDIWILVLSGIIGIALADTLFFYSLNLLGVGLVAIVDCLYSPFAVLFAVWILLEELSVGQYFGAALIVTGVLVSSRHDPAGGKTRRQLLAGTLFGASAMALMAFGIVLAKPVLTDFPLIWATTIRLFAGTVSLAVLAVASPRRRLWWSGFRPSATWKVSIPASVLGCYFCLILWIAGFKYTQAAVAAVLNQTNTIFAIILATLVLREPFGRRKLIATTLAIAGVILVTINSS